MIDTPITRQANKVALKIFADKTDITGYPCMRMRKAVAEQMKDEHTAAIALLRDIYDYSELTEFTLMMEGSTMRVACALSRLNKCEGETDEHYFERLPKDELAYPVALATAKYLGNIDNYAIKNIDAVKSCEKYISIYDSLK